LIKQTNPVTRQLVSKCSAYNRVRKKLEWHSVERKAADVAKLLLVKKWQVTHVEYGSAPPNCNGNPTLGNTRGVWQ